MLTKDEELFMTWWEQNRQRKKKVITQLAVGLPLAVVIFAGVFLNLLSGWYKRADMVIRTHSSTIMVVIIALVAIIVFITVFATRYKWDQHDQHYRELMAKKNGSARV